MRGSLGALLAVAVALTCVGPAAEARENGVAVYGGIGSWVDIFATPARAHPEEVVAALREHGVRTLYLETSNYSHSDAVVHPAVAGRFLDAAHAVGIDVVAWYLPSFRSARQDLAKSLGALRFRSPGGQHFDSFALDIEASVVRSVPLRNVRLLALARAIRAAAGPGYPLGAIIPSPVGMWRHPSYWPGFPYSGLAEIFDAFVPMAYFSHYEKTEARVYAYVRNDVRVIRQETGLPEIPIQLVGGVASQVGGAGLEGFARAAADCGVDGVSLYAYLETSSSQWRRLAGIPLGDASAGAC